MPTVDEIISKAKELAGVARRWTINDVLLLVAEIEGLREQLIIANGFYEAVCDRRQEAMAALEELAANENEYYRRVYDPHAARAQDQEQNGGS